MPAALDKLRRKLELEADKRGFAGERRDKYIWGTIRKQFPDWEPSHHKKAEAALPNLSKQIELLKHGGTWGGAIFGHSTGMWDRMKQKGQELVGGTKPSVLQPLAAPIQKAQKILADSPGSPGALTAYLNKQFGQTAHVPSAIATKSGFGSGIHGGYTPAGTLGSTVPNLKTPTQNLLSHSMSKPVGISTAASTPKGTIRLSDNAKQIAGLSRPVMKPGAGASTGPFGISGPLGSIMGMASNMFKKPMLPGVMAGGRVTTPGLDQLVAKPSAKVSTGAAAVPTPTRFNTEIGLYTPTQASPAKSVSVPISKSSVTAAPTAQSTLSAVTKPAIVPSMGRPMPVPAVSGQLTNALSEANKPKPVANRPIAKTFRV